jgi:purine catabolism regulator
LADLGVVALIARHQLVSNAAKRQADVRRLPVLIVQDDENWLRVVGSVQRDLLLTQIEIYERVQEIHNALSRTMIAGKGLDDIAAVLANLVHNPIVIENDRFEVLAWHNDGAEPDLVRQDVLEAGRVPSHVLEVLARHGVLQRISTESRPFRVSPIHQLSMQTRVMAPIRVGNIRYGHISISESNQPLGELDLMAIEQAATLVALQFSMQQTIRERGQRLEENLVYDILFSQDQTETVIRQRASFLGYSSAPYYVIVLIDVDDFSSVIERERWDEPVVHSIKESLAQRVRGSLASKERPALMASGGDAFIVLYPLHEDESLDNVRGYAQRMQKELSDADPRLTFSVGIGRICDNMRDLFHSHRDAQSAVSAGRIARGGNSIAIYNELGIFSLLAHSKDKTLLSAHLERTVGHLIEYDAERGTELVKTLRVYLHNGGNKTQTASNLFVHLNTVKYRLRKISELTGADLDNSDDVLNLHVGLKIAEMNNTNTFSQ